MSKKHDAYQEIPYPKLRRALAVTYRSVRRKHMVHGLIKVDVSEVRKYLREHKAQTGESLSFTAHIMSCLAQAVDEEKSLNACHKGSRRLVLFDDVDVATAIERELGEHKQPIIYIVRGANHKTFLEIHREIRSAQVTAVEQAWEGFSAERALMLVPMVVLRGMWSVFWWIRGRYPSVQKNYGGTVGLTAVGMFGKGGGWGITLPYHTLDITVGGIGERPGVVDGRIAIREYLCLTLSFDHDVIDGAPAARFVARLKALIEQGHGLLDQEPILQDFAHASNTLS